MSKKRIISLLLSLVIAASGWVCAFFVWRSPKTKEDINDERIEVTQVEETSEKSEDFSSESSLPELTALPSKDYMPIYPIKDGSLYWNGKVICDSNKETVVSFEDILGNTRAPEEQVLFSLSKYMYKTLRNIVYFVANGESIYGEPCFVLAKVNIESKELLESTIYEESTCRAINLLGEELFC